MNDILVDIIRAQDKYIEFLHKHGEKDALYMAVHGYKTSQQVIDEGNDLRDHIKRLKRRLEDAK